VDEHIRQKQQNHYAGDMTDTQRKWLAVAAGLAALVIVGSQLLLARPSPSPTPLFVSVTAPPVSISPVATLAASTTTQPKITWSTTSINVILSPGESTSNDLTFTSSQKLTDVTLSVVPQIAPFVTVQPASISSLAANQAQSVHLSIALATTTKFGTYDGTLQLKSGTTAFPQTVKVVVNVWQVFTSVAAGIKFKYPPGWTSNITASLVNLFPPGSSFNPDAEYTGDISIFIDNNPNGLTAEQYYNGNDNEALFSEAQNVVPTTVNGHLVIRFDGITTAIVPTDVAVVTLSNRFIRVEAVANKSVFESILTTISPL
jgi:hypothetical protein